MAVTKFSERHEDARTVQVADSDPPNTKRYRGFLVITDDKTERETAVLLHADSLGHIPGADHPDHPGCVLVRRSCLPIDDSPFFWRVVLEYTTDRRELDTGPDPLNYRTKVTQGSREITVPHVVDAVTGNPLLNAAGDPPDPPLMMELSFPTFQVTKNFATRPLFIEGFRNTTNNAPLTVVGKTYAAGTFRLRRHTVTDELLHDVFPYFKLVADFEVDPLGFDSVWLNDGLNEYVNGNPAFKQPIMLGGEPVARPVPLQTNGAVVASNNLPSGANTLSAAKYAQVDYSTLGLPAS